MKHRIAYFGSALIVAGAFTVRLASENAEKFDPAMEEMMKAEAACTPGAAHQALEPLVGEWNAELKNMDGSRDAADCFQGHREIHLVAKGALRSTGVQ